MSTDASAAPSRRNIPNQVSVPSIFALQIALTALWEHWGIRPAAVVGHSVGEVASAHVSGALDLAQSGALTVRPRNACSIRTSSSPWARNQGSMAVSSNTRSRL